MRKLLNLTLIFQLITNLTLVYRHMLTKGVKDGLTLYIVIYFYFYINRIRKLKIKYTLIK